MKDDEYRASVEAGPAVVMVAKADMLRLLDRLKAAERYLPNKLSDDQKREIGERGYKHGQQKILAREYGVSAAVIRKIQYEYGCLNRGMEMTEPRDVIFSDRELQELYEALERGE
jgi:hypothetical protein